MRKNYWAVKHDLSRSRIYRIWIGMRGRCNNPNACQYKYYGAKGIRVCEKWDSGVDGFLEFYKWSMENGYSEELTIDRIDPDKGYFPENCRWVDRYMQNVHLSKPPGETGYYGISKHSNHDSFYGRVKVHGKVICTGSANTAIDAAIMRDKYILEHGLPNRLNGVVNGYI